MDRLRAEGETAMAEITNTETPQPSKDLAAEIAAAKKAGKCGSFMPTARDGADFCALRKDHANPTNHVSRATVERTKVKNRQPAEVAEARAAEALAAKVAKLREAAAILGYDLVAKSA
jgi:hypothetical protein